jgi:hypothetical protein
MRNNIQSLIQYLVKIVQCSDMKIEEVSINISFEKMYVNT